MTTLRSTTTSASTLRREAWVWACILVRLAVLCAVCAGIGFVGQGMDTTSGTTTQAPPVAAPAHTPPAGDGWADHDLFNPGATLDTRQIDDLREDPFGKCVMQDGVLTPAGVCVDGVRVWSDEVDAATWNALLGAGYLVEVDDRTSMWIPAEFVIFHGEDGQDVFAVDMSRPLTAR